MKKYILYINLLVVVNSCAFDSKSFFTKPSREKIILTNIKLNGVYVRENNLNNFNYNEIEIYLFYKNGISLSYLIVKKEVDLKSLSKSQLIDSIQKGIDLDYKYHKNRKTAGGFIIKNNEITMQIFFHERGGGNRNTTLIGSIINDTTININTEYTRRKKDLKKMNFNLNFLAMPKPDSTNEWMKRSWYWAD